VLAAKDPEWFEKIESISPADIIAVATEFTKQTVDKVQHGELQHLMSSLQSAASADLLPLHAQQPAALCLHTPNTTSIP
jgi:hypothetical protein